MAPGGAPGAEVGAGGAVVGGAVVGAGVGHSGSIEVDLSCAIDSAMTVHSEIA
jgi:hypothetical protein